ncbi:MAG: hypothetical protein ACI867_000947, partial [Glaciecola sp.]
MSQHQHLEQVRACLLEHRGSSSAEKHHRLQTLRYLDWLRSPMDEFADPTHVTSSAIVCPSAGPPAIVLHK